MNKQISVTDLDFDKIKDNLKLFLKGQSELSDYNFEGSSLSIILDLLAYNTHYNSLYTNLALNESFLDSASKRESVVSLASTLGYVPRSARCSTAIVDVYVTTQTLANFLILPKYTQFSATKQDSKYFFYNTSNHNLKLTDGLFIGRDIELKEGTINNELYTVTDTSKYYISNSNVDISTLTVNVRESRNSTTLVPYTLATDILYIKSTDNVYFIKEIYGNKYEIYFGNDKIGKSLDNGNVVELTYFITTKAEANDIRQFNVDADLGGQARVRTVKLSFGGSDAESIDEIKYNAPKLFNGVNRAVTVDDYDALIKHNYSNVETINVWGGQDNVPPIYGKVFCCIKPKTGSKLTPIEKESIKKDIISKRNIIGVTPELVDPEFLNLQIDVAVYFDKNVTTKSASDISTEVNTNILYYNTMELKKFESVFRYSKLSRLIDDVDSSILSNIMKVSIRRAVTIFYNTNTPYIININNPIYSAGVAEESVTSTAFYLPGDNTLYYLEDDGVGNLRRFKYNENKSKTYVNNKQGTVNYTTGTVTIKNLPISRLPTNKFEIIIKPASNDIISARNTIVQLDVNNINVNSIPYSESSNTDYVFTMSR